jgi:hypothetical protein
MHHSPDFSPDGTKIVYSGHDGGDPEIYTIPAVGGTPTQLTFNTSFDYGPTYSPDGSRIAYTESFVGGDDEIVTMSPTGENRIQLTNNLTHDSHPDYSPDGSRIAYTGRELQGVYPDIYTMPASGGTPHNVTNSSDKEEAAPAYSPDGSRVAYHINEVSGDSEIYTIPSSGGTLVQLTDNLTHDGAPNWGVLGDTDADDDGVLDSEDQCPNEAGPASNNGCPLPPSDTTAPTGRVLINDRARQTTSRNVTLWLKANDPSPSSGLNAYRVKNAGEEWTAWIAHDFGDRGTTSKSWTLTGGQGKKTVYVQYRDAAGNVSARASDSITYRR